MGFMAVKVPAGESEIYFSYETPGLKVGAVVSAAALVLFVIYLLLARTLKIDRHFKPVRLYKAAPFEEYKLRHGCTFDGSLEDVQGDQSEPENQEKEENKE